MRTRTKFLAAAVCCLIAAAVAPFLELLGVRPVVALWTVRLFTAAFFAVVAGYYFACRRERDSGRFQISLLGTFGITALVALLAWASMGGDRPLWAAIVIEGLLIYWRVWVRRTETFSYLGLAILSLLILHFGACLLMAGFRVANLV